MNLKIFFCTFVVSTLLLMQSLMSQQIAPTDTIGRKDSVAQKLNAVEVKGHRSYVKAKDGKLQYNIAPLIKDKAVDNAFEVLRQIPGVMVSGDVVSIAGASETIIVINGRKPSMTQEQILNMLKATPSSKVKNVEVMYAAPPKYGVHGAAININFSTNKSLQNELKGEAFVKAKQAWFFTPSARMNMSYANQKISTDFSYSANYDQSRHSDKIFALQTLNNQNYEIDQKSTGKIITPTHNVLAVVDYQTPDSSHWTLSYDGSFDATNAHRNASTHFSDTEMYFTANHISGPSTLHSIRLDYADKKGLTAGGDYVYYSDRTNQDLTNSSTLNNATAINSESRQKVNQASLYFDNNLGLSNVFTLNYGLNASISGTRSNSATLLNLQTDPNASFEQLQKERNAELYAGVSYAFDNRFSAQLSLSLQYYRAVVDSAQLENTLWNRWDVFPNFSCTYNPAPNHMFQLSFSSDKKYPSYFQTSPSLVYLNEYAVTQGNPSLTPARNYSGALNYILMRKYVVTIFSSYYKGSIQQMPYQSSDILRMNYIQINMDYRNTYGFSGEIPFKIGKIVESKVDATLMHIHDKGMLKEIPFNHRIFMTYIATDNSIFLNKKKSLIGNLSGSYNSSPIQGVYTIDPVFEMNAALMWNFCGDKARLSLRADDIFDGHSVNTRVSLANQHSTMYLFSDSRAVSLSFRYTFSGYKKKQVKEVDTSRFGNGM